MSWAAFVLAGSRGAEDPVASHCGVAHKAFAPLVGRPLITHVIEALSATEIVSQIAVSIERDARELPSDRELTRIDATESPARSVLAALDDLDTPLLVTTADHPLLTPEMISDFLAASDRSGADLCAGVATRETVERAGSAAARTYLKFSDMHLSGCNLFALRTPAAQSAVEFWLRLEADRKRPWRMARQLGLGSLLRYLLGMLSTGAAAERLGRRAGCRVALITLDHAEAAHDVDKPADLEFAAARLAARSN